MATVFEELQALENPWVDFKFAFGKEARSFCARRITAAEQDSLDAFYADEYARLVEEFTESKDGKPSELDRVRVIYRTRPRSDLIQQVLNTRPGDVQRRGAELAGVDLKEVQKHAAELTDEEQRKAYAKEIEDALTAGIKQAEIEMASEYDNRSDEELADLLSQVNINIKAQDGAAFAQDRQRLYYMTFYPNKTERVFPTPDHVSQFRRDTIERLKKVIDTALYLQVARDFPLESPVVREQSGQPSSAKPSEPETTPSNHGGRRTRRRRKNSKQFTKPA